jgi:hypothetical protein
MFLDHSNKRCNLKMPLFDYLKSKDTLSNEGCRTWILLFDLSGFWRT